MRSHKLWRQGAQLPHSMASLDPWWPFPQKRKSWGHLPLAFPVYFLIVFCAGEVQAFYEDLSGRQYVNEVFNFSVDKLYDLLFTDSPFQRDFMEQRRFSGPFFLGLTPPIPSLSVHPSSRSSQTPLFSRPPDSLGHPFSGLTQCQSAHMALCAAPSPNAAALCSHTVHQALGAGPQRLAIEQDLTE